VYRKWLTTTLTKTQQNALTKWLQNKMEYAGSREVPDRSQSACLN
jgi:hypothetical protein